MSTKKVLFIGSGKLLYEIIRIVKKNPMIEVVGVVIESETIGNANGKPIKNVHAINLEKKLKKMKIVFEQRGKIKKLDNSELLQNSGIDFVIVLGWYSIIPKHVISKLTFFGLHASLLPINAGWAPVVWSIIDGDTKTGITLFRIDEGVDTGPIIAQKEVKIEITDTIKDVLKKLAVATVDLVIHILPQLINKTWQERIQNSDSRSVRQRRIPSDGLINHYISREQLNNFVRAQTKPYPGAYAIVENFKVGIESVDKDVKREITDTKSNAVMIYFSLYLRANDGWVKVVKYRSKKQYHKLIFNYYIIQLKKFFLTEKKEKKCQ